MHRLQSCVKIQKIGFDVAEVLSDSFNFPVPLYPLYLTLGVMGHLGVKGRRERLFQLLFFAARKNILLLWGRPAIQRNPGITLL